MKYKKIVCMFDSYKGTFDSHFLGDKVLSRVQQEFPDVSLHNIPMADGGEGTARIVGEILGLHPVEIKTIGAFFQPISITAYCNDEVAVFDVASIVGFKANTGFARNPGKTTSLGVGLVIKSLSELGINKVLIGLGGTLTNDGGCGLLSGLGVTFYNDNTAFVPTGDTLYQIKQYDLSKVANTVMELEYILLSDVTNPLLGDNGATNVFSAQKGATNDQMIDLEAGLGHLSTLFEKEWPGSTNTPGMGAAGGMAYGLSKVSSVKLVSGIDEIIAMSKVAEIVDSTSLVITGEGRFDSQSLSGKVYTGIKKLTSNLNAKLVLIVGTKNLDDVTVSETIIVNYDNVEDYLMSNPSCEAAFDNAVTVLINLLKSDLV